MAAPAAAGCWIAGALVLVAAGYIFRTGLKR
jgi:hypothetical protein